jgi:hypothetical protein
VRLSKPGASNPADPEIIRDAGGLSPAAVFFLLMWPAVLAGCIDFCYLPGIPHEIVQAISSAGEQFLVWYR